MSAPVPTRGLPTVSFGSHIMPVLALNFTSFLLSNIPRCQSNKEVIFFLKTQLYTLAKILLGLSSSVIVLRI